MTFAFTPRLRNSPNMVGPSISGMTTSETMRSILPAFLSAISSASTPDRRLQHGIAARGERAGAESAHRLFVLDEQDRAVAGEIGGRLSSPASLRASSSPATGT